MYKKIKHALIVDDSPEFRHVFRTILTENFVHSVALRDGAEAITYLGKHSIDLLITDFRMPHVDGVELLEWCRKKDLYFPVIFTTSDSQLFTREEIALGDCCATLIKKPLDMRIFHAALEAADRFDHHLNCMHSSLNVEFGKVLGEKSRMPFQFGDSAQSYRP